MRATSLSRRLLLFLACSFAVVLAVALGLLERIADYPAEAARLGENLARTLRLSQRLHEAVHLQDALLQEQIEQLDPGFPAEFSSVNFDVGEMQTQYLQLNVDTTERLTVERIKAAQAELSVKGTEVYARLRSGQRERALRVMVEVEDLARRLDGDFRRIQDLQIEKLREVLGKLEASVLIGKMSLAVLTVVVALALAGMALLLGRRVFGPLSELLTAQARVRGGDFSARAPAPGDDEIGRLAQGFNFMAESLAESYRVLEDKVEERTRQVEALQQQVVQAAKLAALGRLVSGVAHELNNPLTVIVGSGEMLREELGGRGEAAEMVEDLLQQAERCRRIITGLAQFARPQEGQREVVRLNRLADNALELRRFELDSPEVEVLRDYDPSDPELVADAHKLEQLLLNLLNNAYDAIRESGSPGTVWVRTERRGEEALLEIRDTGVGIREPDRVFEPFYTTKEVGKGIGMGLSVGYGIVQEHGGRLAAANWERGARFTATFPVGDPAALAAAPAPAEPGPSPPTEPEAVPPGREALLVEDEEPVRRLQTTFLARLGLKVSTASCVDEAIRFLEQRAVDLVVSDLRMPGKVGGLDLLAWIYRHRPELARRFLFVTGDPSAGSEDDSTVPAHIPCILKPFTLQTYSAVVRRVLGAEAPR